MINLMSDNFVDLKVLSKKVYKQNKNQRFTKWRFQNAWSFLSF